MPREFAGSGPERKNLPPKEAGRERIEDGVWIPGSLAEFADQVAVGSTTKQLEQLAPGKESEKPKPRLRITADPKRTIDDRAELEQVLLASGSSDTVETYRGKKVVAGLILGRLIERLDPQADLHRMIKTRLVHGKEIVLIDEEYLTQSKETLASIAADGLITQMEHVPIMVAAADCAPVFVFDPVTKSMGIFHSGYRGSVARISSQGIRRMVAEFGSRVEDLRVVIGPHIDSENYPIHASLEDDMRNLKDDQDNPLYTAEEVQSMFAYHPQHNGQISFDNGVAIRLEMEKMGVSPAHIEVSELSTVTHNNFLSSDRLEGAQNRDSLMVAAVLK